MMQLDKANIGELDDYINVQFRPDPVSQPWASGQKADSKIAGAYSKQDEVTMYYDRVVPTNFETGTDDLLMRSLITNYSLEGKTDGAPNGHFYLTKDGIE